MPAYFDTDYPRHPHAASAEGLCFWHPKHQRGHRNFLSVFFFGSKLSPCRFLPKSVTTTRVAATSISTLAMVTVKFNLILMACQTERKRERERERYSDDDSDDDDPYVHRYHTVPVGQLRFSHDIVFDRFQDGRLVMTFRDQLRACGNNPNKVNRPIKTCRLKLVQHHGKSHSMDNRRLRALKHAVATHVCVRVQLYPNPESFNADLFQRKMSTDTDRVSTQIVRKPGGARSSSAYVFIPSNQRGALIGKGGENLRNIGETHQCHVNLDSESGFCTILGSSEEAVSEAETYIRLNYHPEENRVANKLAVADKVQLA